MLLLHPMQGKLLREGDTVSRPLGLSAKYSVVQIWNSYIMKGTKNLPLLVIKLAV